MDPNIYICTDNNYAIPTYITLYSLATNYRGTDPIYVNILVSGDFSPRYNRLFRQIEDHFDYMTIKMINMQKCYQNISITSSWISTATLYRLLIPQIARSANIDKCLYLDSDIVVESDITELMQLDLSGYYIGAVKEGVISRDTDLELKRKLDIPSLRNYINAGVMVMNIKEIDKAGISRKLKEAGYRDGYPHNDQGVINVLCYDGIKVLPLRFNAITHYLYRKDPYVYEQYGSSNVENARNKPLIIHYNGSVKPWAYKNTYLAQRWWYYVKMQDNWILEEYINPFIKQSRPSFCARVKEMVKTLTIKMGVYNVISSTYQKRCSLKK